jgi:glycosyltransferase involved in cell wall biosynthesis
MDPRRRVGPLRLFQTRASMRISVVTPSYKQPEWLRLCAASVADQSAPGVEIEHIVQDSLSGPEIAEALSGFPEVTLVSEKDKGMYDAIDRGWKKATGDVLCWLNCDEQFLPGAMKTVSDYFLRHPEVEILFGNTVIVDGEGKYLCSRQVMIPQLSYTSTSPLITLSCATFFRSEVLKRSGLALDTTWKDLGDIEHMIRMLKAKVKMGMIPEYLATFADTGENRNLKPTARQESKLFRSRAPVSTRRLVFLWRLTHRIRRLMHGHYWPKPFSYQIYTLKSPGQRVSFEVSEPTFFWRTRMKRFGWLASLLNPKDRTQLSGS